MALNYNIREIRELSELLTKETNLPFNQISQSFLKRRLYLFGEKKGLKKNEQLTDGLSNSEFKDDLINSIVVPVTELFRDPGTWRKIREHLLSLSNQSSISVWIPQVSTGEELYTLLIIGKEIGVIDKLDILVGYCSSGFMKLVQKGLVSSKKMEINQYNYKRFEGKSSLNDYMSEEGTTLELGTDYLSRIQFKKGCVTTGKPDKQVDLILFRNIMLYYKKEYHTILKEEIDECLKPGGWLCLGAKERLPSSYEDRFECFDEKEKIYIKFNALTH
nr:CheR family methyltransferase [uncultured Carboxylicivirga sp.]